MARDGQTCEGVMQDEASLDEKSHYDSLYRKWPVHRLWSRMAWCSKMDPHVVMPANNATRGRNGGEFLPKRRFEIIAVFQEIVNRR